MGTKLYESISGINRQKKWFINESSLGRRVTGVKILQDEVKEQIRPFNVFANTVPTNAQNMWLEWESSDPSICTCERAATTNFGSCVGISDGTCTITVRTNDGGFTDTVPVTISSSQKSDPPTITYLPVTTNSDFMSGIGTNSALIRAVFPNDNVRTVTAGLFNGAFSFYFPNINYVPQVGDEILVSQTSTGLEESDQVQVIVEAP